MLLAVDIGNTATKLAIFQDGKIKNRSIIPTLKGKTPEELYETLTQENLLFSDVIICSVVPEVDPTFRALFTNFFGKEPIFIDHKIVLDISINYNPPESLGADRLVNAVAASRIYGTPCIICDFGTATTIDVLSSKNEFLGGVIIPGISTLSDALSIKTSKLPKVEIKKPPKLLGNTTIECIQAGIFFGYVGLIEKILVNIKSELEEPPKVIATGGWARLISEELNIFDEHNENLTLEGLQILFNQIKRSDLSITES